MLTQLNLDDKISKADFKREAEKLELRLGRLQRRARELGIPVAIVFEGWGAAGKGTLINHLIHCLDPRGFSVHSVQEPSPDEAMRPFLWRFWTKTPAKGRIAVFDRSWYQPVLQDRDGDAVSEERSEQAFGDIESFERQLDDGGTLVIKFFLHISKSEQKKRFMALEKRQSTAWRVSAADWRQNKHYQKNLKAAEDMLARTDWRHARWNVVAAHDERRACLQVEQMVADLVEQKIAAVGQSAGTGGETPAGAANIPVAPAGRGILAGIDLSQTLSHEEYKERLDAGQKRLRLLEHEMYRRRIPVVIVYEGCDAAGKGGNIRRLTRKLDPRGYEVVPVAAPNDVERDHHYLWRFWQALPKAGHLAIFDRSWYGRVLVERVEAFCSPVEWRRAYEEINAFERQLVNFGTVVIKFWLHIDQDEQLRRFEARKATEDKQWKITEEDWRNREKWPVYKEAVEEMLARTSPPRAPWTTVGSNCKWHARVKCVETVVKAIETALEK